MAHFGADLFAVFEEHPGKTALVCPEKGALSRATCGTALKSVISRIVALDIAPGARIAIISSDPLHATIGLLASFHNHVAAPLNPEYTTEEFLFYLRDLKPGLVLLGEGASAGARAAAEQCGIPNLTITDDVFTTTESGFTLPQPSQPSSPALVLHTSGTTARPKLVELTQANLAASCLNIAQSLKLTENDVSLCAMPLFHVHGLMANLCAALLAGGSVVLAGKFQPEQFVDCLEKYSPSWYSAVPTIHIALIDYLEAREAPPQHNLRLIRSSSAPLPPSVITRLEKHFSAPVIEAYGMTEAAHQIASNPLPPERRKPGTVGLATGSDIRILDDAGAPLSPEIEGNVVICGGAVTEGYVENPEANSEAFREGFFWTGDLGRMDGDGYLTLTGRSKEIVNRGGHKISPREIDEALFDIQGVSDAIAFAQPHQTLGEDLVAAVVPATGADLKPEDIRSMLFERLADYKVPSQIVVVERIPVGATGKRQRLQTYDALKRHFTTSFRAPGNAVELIVCEFTAEVLGLEQVGLDDNFFNCGGNSILGLSLAVSLSELLGCHIPPTAVFRHPTPAALASFAHELLSADDLDRLETAVDALAAPI